MDEMIEKRQFIPRNKPKWWVIMMFSLCVVMISILTSVLLSYFFAISPFLARLLVFLTMVIVFLSLPIYIVSFIAYVVRRVQGKYRHLVSKPWNDQVW